MRVALDCTPALTQHAGVGRYARGLLRALAVILPAEDELVLWSGCGLRHLTRPSLPSRTAALRWVELPVPHRLLPWIWHRWKLPLRLERFLGPIDVCHGLDFLIPPSTAPAVVTIHDVSFLITPHYAHPRLRTYLSTAVRHSLRRAAMVVTVSEQVRHEVCAFYQLPADRVVAIPHGIEPHFRQPDPLTILTTLSRYGLTPPYFLTVGTLEPRKNHRTLLAAFTAVSACDPAVRLVVAGRPGWLCDELIVWLQALERQGRVRWLREVADTDLPALYAGSVAVVYPSWYEGFGFPVLEAMACGTPVIASDLPALREVGGDAAMFVPVGDVDALAAAMLQLLTDQQMRMSRVAAGLLRAQQFTWEDSARRHLAVYQAVAATRAHG